MYSVNYIAADALAVCFDDDIELCSIKISALRNFLLENFREACIDLVPAYDSLTVFVDFPRVYPQLLEEQIKRFFEENNFESESNIDSKNVTVPCCYDTRYGLDIVNLARKKNLSVDEVVEIHSHKKYRVYAVGFSPGFPYLGFVDNRISYPRLSSPRTQVPAGSVGIADQQTGIYPNSSPGGWNIIGRCPLPLFQIPKKHNDKLSMLTVGDLVCFQPIDHEEFLEISQANKIHDRKL